jgi:hypothetical protein
MRTIVIALLLTLTAAVSTANDITGVVADAAGNPLPGARVHIYTATPRMGMSAICPSCYRDCGKQETADAKGEFRLKELDRTLLFNLLAFADGYQPAFVRRVDPAASSPVKIELTPRVAGDPAKLITGVVLDPDGKPVIGATVVPHGYHFDGTRVAWGLYPGVEKMSVTDAKGEFALRIPKADTKLDVRVMARSYAPKIERAIAPRERREIRLIEGVTVSGRVMRDRTPVPSVRVKAIQQDRRSDDFLGGQEIGTNEDGFFVLTNLAPEQEYLVHVAMESGMAAEPKVVTTGPDGSSADAGTLAVQQGRRIGGMIVVPEGVTLPPDAQIWVVARETSDWREVPVRNGTFSVDGVTPGEVQLMLRAPGLRIAPASTGFDPEHSRIEVAGDADCTDLRVVLEKW